MLSLLIDAAGASFGPRPDEIWLCGGQSNMAFPVSDSVEAALIAGCLGEARMSLYKDRAWVSLSKESAGRFSSVAVAFAMERSIRTGKVIAACRSLFPDEDLSLPDAGKWRRRRCGFALDDRR